MPYPENNGWLDGLAEEEPVVKNEEYGKVTRAETSTTWESGKLKLTLTRKSTLGSQGQKTTEDKVTVVNKEGATRSPQSDGFMWSGSLDAFMAFSKAIGLLCAEVDAELFDARPVDPGIGSDR